MFVESSDTIKQSSYSVGILSTWKNLGIYLISTPVSIFFIFLAKYCWNGDVGLKDIPVEGRLAYVERVENGLFL